MKVHQDVMAPALLIVEQPAGRRKTGPRFIRRLIAERRIEYHKVGRHVAFPGELVPELRWHLEQFTEPGERGCVFVGPKGGRLRRSNFRLIWHSARMAVNLPDLHFMISAILAARRNIESIPAQLGGSARGYQELFAPLTVSTAAARHAVSPYISACRTNPDQGSGTGRSRAAWEQEYQVWGSSRSSRHLCNRLIYASLRLARTSASAADRPRCLGYWGSVRTVCAAASG